MSPSKKAFEYEFGGPIGAGATVAALPILILLLAHWTDVGSVDLHFLADFRAQPFWTALLNSSIFFPSWENKELLLSCSLGLIAWFCFQVLLERYLPCELVEGAPIKGDAKAKLTYRINGHLAFWVTLLVVHVGYPYWDEKHQLYQLGGFPLGVLYQYYHELAFCTILICFAISLYLYLNSFNGDKILADGGDSGNSVYDFFIGRELNPRIGSFDWKEFCELRPGLIGWMLLNLSCAKQQYDEMGYVTGSMLLLNIFQGIYVWDALYQERAILTTMDITTDGLGFMLTFGDLAWVPFTYSIQARYLVHHDPHLSALSLACILGLHVAGYAIFRGANGQKDAFRRNPDDPKLKHLTYLQTKRGTKLLTSGWWGAARKINYTGDYLIGLTWCLVCGFQSIVPYFYAIYFLILLVHRSIRDDHMCHVKYGDDWLEYKNIVPYRFIPGVV
jgi:delta14-sterol reductase/lamin-B receptor